MTTTPSRRHARRARIRRRRIRRSALASGAAVLGILLPSAGLAAAHAAEPVDDVPPVLNRYAYAPNSNGWHRGDPNLSVVVEDFGRGDSEIESVSYILDGGPVQTIMADPGTLSFLVRIDLYSHGIHDLEVWARDTAGNETFHQTGTYRVDLKAPTVTVPPNGVFPVGSEAHLLYSCEDELSGIDTCTSPVPSGGLLDTSTPGTRQIPVTATDKAGNTTTTAYTYTVGDPDTAGPEIEYQIAPEPASGWYRSYLGIGFAASDPAGISSLHWHTDGAVSANGDVYDSDWGAFELTFDGVTEVWAWAYDRLGNRTETPGTPSESTRCTRPSR